MNRVRHVLAALVAWVRKLTADPPRPERVRLRMSDRQCDRRGRRRGPDPDPEPILHYPTD